MSDVGAVRFGPPHTTVRVAVQRGGSPFFPGRPRMAFTSDESGRIEVYVAPFPPTGVKRPVSAGVYMGMDFQAGARWNPNGRELFYVSTDGRLMAVSVGTAPNLQLGRPSALLKLPGGLWEDFAVSADGQRFLAVVLEALAGDSPSRSDSTGLPTSSGESAADSNFSCCGSGWIRDECGTEHVFDFGLAQADRRSGSRDRCGFGAVIVTGLPSRVPVVSGFTRRFCAPIRSWDGADRHHYVRVIRRRVPLHRSGTRPSLGGASAAAGAAGLVQGADRGRRSRLSSDSTRTRSRTIARWRRASWIRCVAATPSSPSC